MAMAYTNRPTPGVAGGTSALDDTRHIGKIRIPIRMTRTSYLLPRSAMPSGAIRSAASSRSTDGGASWEQVLFVSDKAGAVDLSIDETNPRIIYAQHLGGPFAAST